ncbi:hypothetical protein SAVIM338S_01347 [Streptomyces avidinii]
MGERKFKVVIVGDGSVGKTTSVRKLCNGGTDRALVPTVGAETSLLSLDTSGGTIVLEVWDTAGQEKSGGLRDGYYADADAAVLMFDVTTKTSYKNVSKWSRDVERVAANAVMILVGNKADVAERELTTSQITFHEARNIPYIETSAQDNTGLAEVLRVLASRLTNTNLVVKTVNGRPLPEAPPSPARTPGGRGAEEADDDF